MELREFRLVRYMAPPLLVRDWMSNDLLPRAMRAANWLPRLRRVLLACALSSVPVVIVAGCAAPTTGEESDGSGSALSGHEYKDGTILRVTSSLLNVRERGNSSAKIVAVLEKDDLVTVSGDSGGSGWVSILTPDGDEGWASGTYLKEDGADSNGGTEDTSTRDGATCEPSRAVDVVNKYEKALHDVIADAEGTRDVAKDGYNIIFGSPPPTIASCANHPNRCMKFGRTCSTAAGRYQILYATWSSVAKARGYATFEPENQERAAAYLIASVRRVTVPADRALTSSEFSNAITMLSGEWASLPGSKYGQPTKTMTYLRGKYCEILGC